MSQTNHNWKRLIRVLPIIEKITKIIDTSFENKRDESRPSQFPVIHAKVWFLPLAPLTVIDSVPKETPKEPTVVPMAETTRLVKIGLFSGC